MAEKNKQNKKIRYTELQKFIFSLDSQTIGLKLSFL